MQVPIWLTTTAGNGRLQYLFSYRFTGSYKEKMAGLKPKHTASVYDQRTGINKINTVTCTGECPKKGHRDYVETKVFPMRKG